MVFQTELTASAGNAGRDDPAHRFLYLERQIAQALEARVEHMRGLVAAQNRLDYLDREIEKVAADPAIEGTRIAPASAVEEVNGGALGLSGSECDSTPADGGESVWPPQSREATES